jgi:hypothetical protein
MRLICEKTKIFGQNTEGPFLQKISSRNTFFRIGYFFFEKNEEVYPTK